MKNEKDKWIEEVFESVEGIHRAEPSANLFAKIEQQVFKEGKTISMQKAKLLAVASILLVFVNIFALSKQIKQNSLNIEVITNPTSSNQDFISNYNLYE